MRYIILLLAITGLTSSCKKSWLEIVPLGDRVAQTTDDYDKLMNNNAYYYTSTGGWSEAQLMGDEVAAETPFFNNIGIIRDRLFQWKDSIYPIPQQSPFTLSAHLEQMYTWNKVIAEVMSSTDGTEASKKRVRAEAKATRAWSNFNMANFYCKPYNASSANTDPGFPIITEPNVNTQSFPRGTVQGFYDFIINDLKEALPDLAVKPNIVTRMSKPAVEGLLGKVYVFMGKFNEALPYLNDAVSHVTSNGQTTFYDYNQTFQPNGAFMPINNLSGPNSPGQIRDDIREAVLSKVWYSGSYNGNLTGNNGLVLTPAAQALYTPGDFRLLFYTDRNPNNAVNAAGRIRKYGVSYSRWGLQLADLYLLRAECKARLNDLGGAVADLEMLRKNRMTPATYAVPGTVAGNQPALIRFVIDERIREFAGEGYRWFDMRRLSQDPIFAPMTFTHTMYNSDGSTTIFTLKQPTRLVMKFPRFILDTNPYMEDNP